jgi:hypothetical protein
MEKFMKRKLVVSASLAFLFCSILDHAQDQPENAIVHTPGGKVNVVAKFTGTSVIGDSAISESGGNVKVTGKVTAGGTVSGSDISTGGTVSGTSGSFTSSVNAGSYNLNGIAFAYGSGPDGNAFLGFAGNTTTTGTDNTATLRSSTTARATTTPPLARMRFSTTPRAARTPPSAWTRSRPPMAAISRA